MWRAGRRLDREIQGFTFAPPVDDELGFSANLAGGQAKPQSARIIHHFAINGRPVKSVGALQLDLKHDVSRWRIEIIRDGKILSMSVNR